MNGRKYRVIGYVKLAKLWQRSGDEAVEYHKSYYKKKFENSDRFTLVGVYVDITGEKQIYKRKEMLKVLSACKNNEADVIAVQTRAYLASNSMDFFYLLKYLFDLPDKIDIITEDLEMQIDTLSDRDNQRHELSEMADKFVALEMSAYNAWKDKVNHAVAEINEGRKF